ncbi:uncharacterized protein LOC116404797 [Cucumis sativus]|uniref:Uncharacterized protein n=1 Tax=Cucumis sativus TaxID=3659 RepID=A0A0A0KBM2_CUCSA|nr:uncharacterized protein LOC116404797 [Cucumis sativus]KGN47075.1 hypothetical protein Csa_020779 [Cucumis sativus]
MTHSEIDQRLNNHTQRYAYRQIQLSVFLQVSGDTKVSCNQRYSFTSPSKSAKINCYKTHINSTCFDHNDGVMAGKHILLELGRPIPSWYYSLTAQQFYIVAIPWLLGCITINYLRSTEDFQLFFNDNLVFCK